MKKTLTFSFLLLFSFCGFGQDIRFNVSGNYKHSITNEKIKTVKKINDLIPDYPKNWIQDLISIDISIDNKIKHISSNETLTPQQINILRDLDIASEVFISVMYHKKNPVTEFLDVNIMNFNLTIIPKKEAEYLGGKAKLNAYLKENAILKIQGNNENIRENGQFNFTINEDGSISDVCVHATTDDVNINQVLIDALKNMPPWIPAESENGKKVKQTFKFNISNIGGC
jgi:hypothetical protein